MSSLENLDPKLLNDIRTVLNQARGNLRYTINHTMIKTYWEIGRLIVEYQKLENKNGGTVKALSMQLQGEFGKGFEERNLRNMRAFYLEYQQWNAVRSELSWTHYRILLRIENPDARNWYMHECIEQNWSSRALERQISKLYYERLLSSKDKLPVVQEAERNTQELREGVKDYLRDPYILDFLELPYAALLESKIEQALMNNLQQFLLELGKGFAFVARQQRIATEDQDFYIDLVFYNFKLKCFLLIDLKLGKLNHQDVGQMDTYVRIYDQLRKGKDDNPTVGLILCSETSEAVAKYSVLTESRQLFASKYLPYLPTEDELRRELERERAFLTDKPDQKED